jgi:hypothetical protein
LAFVGAEKVFDLHWGLAGVVGWAWRKGPRGPSF